MTKNRKIRILIILTLLVSLILSLTSLAYTKVRDAKGSPVFNDIENPIYEFDSVYLDWPKVSGDSLYKSIDDYQGNLNIERFESEFKEEFNKNNNTDLDVNWFTFSGVNVFDGEYSISVHCNTRMDRGKYIRNQSKTYVYEVKENT